MADPVIYRTTDAEFKPYGRVTSIPQEELSELLASAETLEMPECGAKYEASVDVFERLKVAGRFRNEFFGELPIEIGCCWGHNNQLGALEWHASSEINVAATDFVLVLGKLDEMEGRRYDASRTKAFLIEKGQAVEIYGTTLHYCPCTENVDGFRCVVVLPKDTNLPLERPTCDPLLFRKNKWIICHEENKALAARGAFPGLFGDCFTPEQ